MSRRRCHRAVLKATLLKPRTSVRRQPAVFKAAVDRYNELVKIGKDLDFGKEADT
jgi:hypothetical protein